MVYKGVIAGTATSPGAFTPAANCGDTYKVSAEGYINGQKVEIGDMLICTADSTVAATSSNYETVQATWSIVQTNLDGAVIGPANATENHFASFNGSTGKLIVDSGYSADSFAAAGHDHSIDLQQTGSSPVQLAANTTYTLTAGGQSIVFKTPADANTLVRTYKAYETNVELPLIGGSTGSTSPAAPTGETGSANLYGQIPKTTANRATYNLSTGKITVPGGIVANVTGISSQVTTTEDTTNDLYLVGVTATDPNTLKRDTGIVAKNRVLRPVEDGVGSIGGTIDGSYCDFRVVGAQYQFQIHSVESGAAYIISDASDGVDNRVITGVFGTQTLSSGTTSGSTMLSLGNNKTLSDTHNYSGVIRLYGTDAGNVKMQYNSTTKSLDFIFA